MKHKNNRTRMLLGLLGIVLYIIIMIFGYMKNTASFQGLYSGSAMSMAAVVVGFLPTIFHALLKKDGKTPLIIALVAVFLGVAAFVWTLPKYSYDNAKSMVLEAYSEVYTFDSKTFRPEKWSRYSVVKGVYLFVAKKDGQEIYVTVDLQNGTIKEDDSAYAKKSIEKYEEISKSKKEKLS